MKARGICSLGAWPTDVSSPVEGSTAKQAMLLWPRLGAYKNFPDGVIRICEQEFCPVYPSGKVDTVCTALRVPAEASKRYAVTLHPCSLEK